MKIVFDIGGTSIRAASVVKGALGDIRKAPTPQGPKEGIEALAKLVRECAGEEPLEAAAGGFPGVIGNGTVHFAPNLPQWRGLMLTAEISRAFGAPVKVKNDSECAALGEALYGAGKGARIVVYLGVGTGVGCARVVDGRVDGGVYSAEAGHQILDAGRNGGLEELVSGRAFERRFGVHPRDASREAYEHMAPTLAAGLYNMMLHWSPDVFVLGGSMMNEENGYRIGDIKAALEKLPRVYPRLPELRAAQLKDEAGLYGAMSLLG